MNWEEFLSALEYMEREKGIDREKLLSAVEMSLVSASRKTIGPMKNLSVEIDRKTGAIHVFSEVSVVDKDNPGKDEVTLEEAREINPKASEGDTLKMEVTQKDFGRIAAQTAKQVIIQKIREAEREVIYHDFKERIGDITTGILRRFERGNIIIDLGKTEAVLPAKERSPNEDYALGQRLRIYILDVRSGQRGAEIIVSRSHPGLVKRLFELEVPEIFEGAVEIKSIAREAGYRTKIAVVSREDKIDCVGACVGMRGSRVKNIVRELNGERIDIVRWSDTMEEYIGNALSPAKLKSIKVNEAETSAEVVVDAEQLSLAIGKKGQNARLTARLTGWKIDIRKEGEETPVSKKKDEDMMASVISEAADTLKERLQVTDKIAQALVESGFTDIAGILASDINELTKVPGIGQKRAEKIISAARQNTNAE